MSVSSDDLDREIDKVNAKISEIISGRTEADSAAVKQERRKRLKELQAVRDGFERMNREAMTDELNRRASSISAAAVEAQRQVVERVMAGFAAFLSGPPPPPRQPPVSEPPTDSSEPQREMVEDPGEQDVDVEDRAPPVVPKPLEADPVLMRRSTFGHPVFGHLVAEVQRALLNDGFDPKGVDMFFGSDTTKALREWRVAHEFSDVATVTVQQWSLLTGKEPPDLFDICAQVTAAFEGHGFTKAVGDFDGAVATFGYLGYTLKFDHLLKVLEEAEAASAGILADAFGTNRADGIKRHFGVSQAKRTAWGRETLLHPDGKMKQDWATAFAEFGGRRAAQAAQLAYSRRRFWEAIALPQAARLGLTDPLSLGMLFDAAIQQGGASKATLRNLETAFANDPEMSDEAKRKRLAQALTKQIRGDRFRQDVKSRRATFVDGTGRVHGKTFDLNFWGLFAAVDEAEGEIPIIADGGGEAELVPQDFATWFAENVTPVAPNFTAKEFLVKGGGHASGSCAGLNEDPPRVLWENCIPLAKVLQGLREAAGAEVVLLNVYRSPAYNTCIGGVTKSRHKEFRAADIKVKDGNKPKSWHKVLKAMRDRGEFKGGLGLYKTFVHVDTRGFNADWRG